MKVLRHIVLAAVLALSALSCIPAFAQNAPAAAIQSVTPMTRDKGAIITSTLQAAGTVVSPDQSGYNVSRVICVVVNTGGSTPTVTLSLQNKDAASGQYYTVITGTVVTALNTPTPLSMGAGLATTANVSSGTPVAAKWRLSALFAGTTTTGTIGCSVQ
jgi:hypothetical protein